MHKKLIKINKTLLLNLINDTYYTYDESYELKRSFIETVVELDSYPKLNIMIIKKTIQELQKSITIFKNETNDFDTVVRDYIYEALILIFKTYKLPLDFIDTEFEW